jgi:glycosyltransferase involved in cell wall biosynthesis
MKVLYVTGTLPYPPRTGSQLIAYRHIEHLARQHQVDLVSYADPGPEFGELARWCGTIVTVPARPLWQVKAGMLRAFVTGRPLEAGQFWTRAMAEAVEARLRADRYDVAVFQLSGMAQFRPVWFDGVAILSMEDPLVLKAGRTLHHRRWYKRFLFDRNIARLQRYEREQVDRFDRVLLLNRTDMQEYAAVLPNARLDWVPHGVDTTFFTPSATLPRVPGRIVLSGNMFHPPNVEGVHFFCGEILPHVLREIPDAETWLVGANPHPSVTAWAARAAGVHVTGHVPDMRPYLQQAMVSVCAVRLRIGTQTKILEAMACGAPVVTTTAGNHGIEGVDGLDLDVSDDPRELAARIVRVLTDPNWKDRSVRARAFVNERFTWSASGNRFESVLESALSNRRC